VATTPERPLNELYGATNTREINTDLWNGLLREVQNRFVKLEILREGLEGVLAQSQTIALDRINEVLTPAIDQINADLAMIADLIEEAQSDLQEATEDALSQVAPLINEKFTAINALIATATTAISNANTAASNANAAASSITDVRRGTATVISTTGQTAVVGGRYKIDTSGGAITLNLPAAPAEGEHVTTWREGASNATLARNGKTIEGLAEDLVIDTDKNGVKLTYVFGTWRASRELDT
jgi:hypothetical protein